jgi:hypothetical protein
MMLFRWEAYQLCLKYSQAKIVEHKEMHIVRQVLSFILRNVKENTEQVKFGVFMPMDIKIIFQFPGNDF